MKYNDNLIKRSQEITKEVIAAEKVQQPIEHLVKEQIEILESHHDEFAKMADAEGIDDLYRARIEVQLYTNIKTWANKIGLSTEKYDKAIRNIRVRFLGEKNTDKYFNT